MAAPGVTARGTPAGIKMDDGHSTVIAFERNPTISFWEKSVTPPGLDGGDAIETFTMHSETWRTKAPRALRDMTECTATVAYDPNLFNQIIDMINIEQAITVHFPDGSTLAFFGYLRVFEPSENQEGEQPEAEITIQPTNQDPTTGAEEDPVLTSVSGT